MHSKNLRPEVPVLHSYTILYLPSFLPLSLSSVLSLPSKGPSVALAQEDSVEEDAVNEDVVEGEEEEEDDMEVSDEDGEEEGEPVTVPATTEEEEEEVCVRWSDGDCVNSVLVTLVVFWTDQLSWWYFPSHL